MDFYAASERGLHEAARAAVADRRATITRHESDLGAWFELIPAKPNACPLVLTPQDPDGDELRYDIGFQPATLSRWADREQVMVELRNIVTALIEGRYEEWFSGCMTIGVLHLDSGDMRFSSQTFRRRPPLGWDHRRYAAY